MMSVERNRILVVDDDPDIRALLRDYLTREGFEVREAGDGAEMRDVLRDYDADLVILDLVLPGEDGLTLARQLREKHNLGIIILTGKGETVDLVVGLEMGADDYVPKPFANRELLARIRSVLRRTHRDDTASPAEPTASNYRFAEWTLAMPSHHLTADDGRVVSLTATEFRLLCAFLKSPNTVIPRETLYKEVYGKVQVGASRAIDVLIGRLRNKLEAERDKPPRLIKTVHGDGYSFTPEERRG